MALTGDSIRDGYLSVPLKAAELVSRLKPVEGDPLRFRVDCGGASLEYIPYYRIGTEEFTCYPFFE